MKDSCHYYVVIMRDFGAFSEGRRETGNDFGVHQRAMTIVGWRFVSSIHRSATYSTENRFRSWVLQFTCKQLQLEQQPLISFCNSLEHFLKEENKVDLIQTTNQFLPVLISVF